MKIKQSLLRITNCIVTALFWLPASLGTAQTTAAVQISSNSMSKEGVIYMQNLRADPLYDWKQPIILYGKVLDENGQPIPNAVVSYEWTDLSANGSSKKECASDGAGLFTIQERGKRLCLTVKKPDYYSTRDARSACFEYANPFDGLFKPDLNNRVVFHLRKKGVGVDLITSQQGVSPDFPIHIPRDGTTVIVDVMKRKVGDVGQIQISESKPEQKIWKQATNWSFRMEIPDGGFVETKDEFMFEAPVSDYQPVVDFQFQKGDANWKEAISKKYYIKFGSPPHYGRLEVQTGISYGGAILTYAINPDGSRNLEPK